MRHVALVLVGLAACGRSSTPRASEASAPAAASAPPTVASAVAPSSGVPVDDPQGTWEGTSLCLVHPSPCHDELAVYHVSAKGGDTYEWVGNKRVDGVEEHMGTVTCTHDGARHRLVCPIGKGEFRFTVDGEHMRGEAILTDGTRYRAIDVTRTSRRP